MKRSEVKLFVRTLHRLILTGQTEEAAMCVARPFVLYFPDKVVVEKDTAAIVARMALLGQSYAACGIAHVEAVDVDVRDCTGNRAFVSLRLVRFQSEGRSIVSRLNNYVLRRNHNLGSLIIELADITSPSFSDTVTVYAREFGTKLHSG